MTQKPEWVRQGQFVRFPQSPTGPHTVCEVTLVTEESLYFIIDGDGSGNPSFELSWDDAARIGVEEVPICEADGDIEDQHGRDHYWHCGEVATQVVNGRKTCDAHPEYLGVETPGD
jgi:hypothetical protein